jgi:hypothetical protein
MTQQEAITITTRGALAFLFHIVLRPGAMPDSRR